MGFNSAFKVLKQKYTINFTPKVKNLNNLKDRCERYLLRSNIRFIHSLEFQLGTLELTREERDPIPQKFYNCLSIRAERISV